jgi:hypothetical protein
MFRNWFHNRFLASSRSPRQARATFKPAVEGLEDRQLLSASMNFAASAVAPDAVWYTPSYQHGGTTLYEHVNGIATNPSVNIPNGIAQVSAAKNWAGGDAVFVLDGANQVWECVRWGNTIATPTLIAGGVQEISGSMVAPDTVFTISADPTHSITEFRNNSFFVTSILSYPLGLPSSGGPFQASDISAGKDGTTGQEAVFVNFSGAVYEHKGLTANAGWSYVAGVNLNAPHSVWIIPFAVSDFSASQVAGDTVFTINELGNLYENVGSASGYTSLFVTSGVSQVSAGVDASGHATAFTLTSSGSLDEYTYYPGSIPKHISPYWEKTHIGGGSALSASQVQSDTVYSESPGCFWTLNENSGQSLTGIYTGGSGC